LHRESIMIDMKEIRIKEIAKQKGLPMSEVAKRMGYRNTSSLSAAMKRSNVTLAWLDRAATALDVEISELFVSDKIYITCPHCHRIITIKTE